MLSKLIRVSGARLPIIRRPLQWHLSWADAGLFALFGLLLPISVAYLATSNLQLGVTVALVVVAALVLWGTLYVVTPPSPLPVKLIMTAALGQLILNMGFSNIVIGSGSFKLTAPELVVMVGVLFLLPRTYGTLKRVSYFWVALLAIAVPLFTHLYWDYFTYKIAAFRDFLTVVDIVYFIGGMAVCACGLQYGQWTAWRNRFIGIWLIGGVIYMLTSPFSSTLIAVSPRFDSYQQSVPVLGFYLTAPVNFVAAVVALFAMPEVFPRPKLIRWGVIAMITVGGGALLAAVQSRNLYIICLFMPFLLAMFGYRRAVAGALVALLAMILVLGLLEAYEVRIAGRISNVTLSAVVDRLLSISGKHGDHTGAAGVQKRQDWLMSTLDKWSTSPETIVFGLGYGMPLTNFTGPSIDGDKPVIVREPHNSFLSSLARGGVVYFVLWAYIVLGSWYLALKVAMARGRQGIHGSLRGYSIWVALVMFASLIHALSEPQFENPSTAMQFYIVAGMFVVEYTHQRRQQALGQMAKWRRGVLA